MTSVSQTVPGVVEVRCNYILSGENCENVYHVANDTGEAWTLVHMEDIASAFADWEDVSAKGSRSVACALHNITVTDLTSLEAERITRPLTPPIAGTVAGDALPNNATFALKADVHNRGRGKSGRTFWIGLAELQTAGSTILSSDRDNIITAMNALITAVEAIDPTYRLVIVHRVVGGIRPPEAAFSQIFLFGATDDTIDSQKNRLPNHRRRSKKRITP